MIFLIEKLKTMMVTMALVIMMLTANAQEPGSKELKVPPSPDAGHLGTYGELSVSKATGSADITIPILTLEEGGVKIPITLSYQSSGMRVDERPSWVGMNWLLSAGGVITRTMRGRHDDLFNGFLRNSSAVPNASIVNTDLDITAFRFDVYTKLDFIARNEIDYIPDAFSFNFLGNGGAFFFGNDGKVHCVEHNSLRFEPIFGSVPELSGNMIIGWTVVDADGLIYTFKAIEITSVRTNEDEAVPPYISSWYLTSIHNPRTGTVASFSYDGTYYEFEYPESTRIINYQRNSTGTQWIWLQPTVTTQTVKHKNVKFLSSITLGNHHVDFVNSATLEPFRKLNNITWTNGSATREFEFQYDYFPSSCSTADCKRLRLNSMTEINPTNPSSHSFEYYPGNLPKKRDFAQDHWGYYNGKSSNTSLVPDVVIGNETLGDGADRSPSFNHTLRGMLYQIKYPTKGTSTFSYEQNTWEDQMEPEEAEEILGEYQVRATGVGNWGEACSTWTSPSVGSGEFRLDYHGRLSLSGPMSGRENPQLTIIEYPSKVIRTETIRSTDVYGSISTPELKPGKTYLFKICAYGSTATGIVDITYVKVNNTEGETVARPTGGLRVSRIENFDPESGVTVTRTFDYGKGGYLVWRNPIYSRVSTCGGSTSLTISSTPTGGLGPSSLPVAYQKVVEWLGTKDNNTGRIETIFIKAVDNTAALTLQESRHTERTKVDIENYYDKDGVKVKSVDYAYSVLRVAQATGFRALGNSCIPRDYNNDFHFGNIFIESKWHQLTSRTTVHKSPVGDITESVYYEYNSDLHTNPTKETIVNVKGVQKHKEYTYAIDQTTCSNDCFSDYMTQLNTCNSYAVKHSMEGAACESKYQSCFVSMVACRQTVDQIIDESCRPFGSNHLGCIGQVKSMMDCMSAFDNCLSETDGYFSCLDALGSDYEFEQCQKEAFINYGMCQDNFDDCLLAEYNSNTDIHQKSVALANVNNLRSLPVEIRGLEQSAELTKSTFQYGIWDEKPLLQSKSISYHGGTQTTSLVVNHYDSRGNPTEVIDRKEGFPKAYIWGYHSTEIIAEFKNASVVDVAHSSFETASNEGNLMFQLSPSSESKTGTQSHLLASGSITKSGLTPSRRYVVSYWAKSGTPTVTGVVSSNERDIEADGWKYFEKIVTNVTTVTISGTGTTKIDELRVAPEHTLVTTFTHQPGFGITSMNDANNQIAYYTYEASGKLELIQDHYRNILRRLIYHYKN